MQQILTSADWGGVVGNFFTGERPLATAWYCSERMPAWQTGSASTATVLLGCCSIYTPAGGAAWRRPSALPGALLLSAAGGLNLQVEHHLFPAISFCHYPAIADIVKDECAKRGVPYARYDTLPEVRPATGAPPAAPQAQRPGWAGPARAWGLDRRTRPGAAAIVLSSS